jgi:hypothetical protein
MELELSHLQLVIDQMEKVQTDLVGQRPDRETGAAQKLTIARRYRSLFQVLDARCNVEYGS